KAPRDKAGAPQHRWSSERLPLRLSRPRPVLHFLRRPETATTQRLFPCPTLHPLGKRTLPLRSRIECDIQGAAIFPAARTTLAWLSRGAHNAQTTKHSRGCKRSEPDGRVRAPPFQRADRVRSLPAGRRAGGHNPPTMRTAVALTAPQFHC